LETASTRGRHLEDWIQKSEGQVAAASAAVLGKTPAQLVVVKRVSQKGFYPFLLFRIHLASKVALDTRFRNQ